MPIRVGCAVLVKKDEQILLGRRGKEPMFGKMVIPGGGIADYESYKSAGQREILEETGLTVTVNEIIHVAEIINDSKEHRIVLYADATVIGGDLRASSDLLDVGFYDRQQIANLASAGELTPTVAKVLQTLGWLG